MKAIFIRLASSLRASTSSSTSRGVNPRSAAEVSAPLRKTPSSVWVRHGALARAGGSPEQERDAAKGEQARQRTLRQPRGQEAPQVQRVPNGLELLRLQAGVGEPEQGRAGDEAGAEE